MKKHLNILIASLFISASAYSMGWAWWNRPPDDVPALPKTEDLRKNIDDLKKDQDLKNQKIVASSESIIKTAAKLPSSAPEATVITGEAKIIKTEAGGKTTIKEQKIADDRVAAGLQGKLDAYKEALDKSLKDAESRDSKYEEIIKNLNQTVSDVTVAKQKAQEDFDRKLAAEKQKSELIASQAAQESVVTTCRSVSFILFILSIVTGIMCYYFPILSKKVPALLLFTAGLVLSFPLMTGIVWFPYLPLAAATFAMVEIYRWIKDSHNELKDNDKEYSALSSVVRGVENYSDIMNLSSDDLKAKDPLFQSLSKSLGDPEKSVIKEVKSLF